MIHIHGNIISIKENKEHHGYGLKSIRKTVEKYDGELVVEIRGNIFRAVAWSGNFLLIALAYPAWLVG